MAMTPLAKKVLEITSDYLGPSSLNFLNRQAKAHMEGLVFGDLRPEHLSDLSKWVKISAGLLIEKESAKDLAAKILIAKGSSFGY